MYLFSPSERESIGVPERCHGQAEIYCLLCFLGFLRARPRPASAGSVGPRSCPRLAWRAGGTGVGSGAGAERLARLVFSPASVYVSTELSWPGTQNRHCVLGDSLAPNSAGNAGESGFQGHFRFYSSGKTFGVCLKVCSNPWPLVETASRWQGVGGPHSGLPSLAPMTPQTGSSPGGQGLIHLCVPTPEGCSVT